MEEFFFSSEAKSDGEPHKERNHIFEHARLIKCDSIQNSELKSRV